MKKKTKKTNAKRDSLAALRRQLDAADDTLFLAVEAIEELARTARALGDRDSIESLRCSGRLVSIALRRAAGGGSREWVQ